MNNSMSRRHFLSASSATALALNLYAPALWAEDIYPSKPIKVVLPLPAGGTADASMRIFSEQFQLLAKQNVIIENKPGGNFQIGMQAITQAPADGYSLIHLNSGMVSAQVVNKKYDLLKQLIPVSLMGVTDSVMAAAPNAPFKTTKEMIAWAKANPGKLNYGTAGTGSIEHLTMASFSKKHGFTATMIPYKGGPDAMTALVQGEIHIFTTALPLVFQFLSKGVKPLSVMVDKRSTLMPEVSTLKEQGFDFHNLRFWGGLAAPLGTPKAVIETLQVHINAAMSTAALTTKFTSLGMTPLTDGTTGFSQLINNDIKWMGAAASDLDLKLN